MEFDYDAIEEGGGHKLVLIHGMQAGCTTYTCDRCASLFFSGYDKLLAFVAAGDATPLRCPGGEPRGVAGLIRQLDELLSPSGDDDAPHPRDREIACPRCRRRLDYAGEPHGPECVVREVMET